MCEICELRKKLSEEIEFRILQYQKERNFPDQTKAKERAIAALEDIFIELDKVPELEVEIKIEQSDLLTGKKKPEVH